MPGGIPGEGTTDRRPLAGGRDEARSERMNDRLERIQALSEAGADAFGVGSYVSAAPPIDMTMDLREISGRPIAKRGRTPGRTPTTRLRS